MNDAHELEGDVLKGVSRSFYLSLRFLPAPMRGPAGIAYLLARASDTIADSATIPAAERIAFLDLHARQIDGLSEATPYDFPIAEESITNIMSASSNLYVKLNPFRSL